MPWSDAARSRTLAGLLLAVAVLPLAALFWLGWRLAEQDRTLERQQVRQRIDLAADLVVAALQRAIASAEQRVTSDDRSPWADGAAAVTFHPDDVRAIPPERVAYYPIARRLPEAADRRFQEGDDLEFRQRKRSEAVAFYRSLATSPERTVRAGALLRLARNLTQQGQNDEPAAIYAGLAGVDDQAVSGVPIGLASQYARCQLLELLHRQPELTAEARRLYTDLINGRWHLTGSVYWLYKDDAARWSGVPPSGHTAPELMAEVVGRLWNDWRLDGRSFSRRATITVGDQAYTVISSGSSGSLQAVVAAPAFVKSEWLVSVATLAREQQVSITFSDADLRPLFVDWSSTAVPTTPVPARTFTVTRHAGPAGLPWTLAVREIGLSAGFAERRQLQIAGFVLLAVLWTTAGYLIVRAVNRELGVARLKGDFIAAVSHEFRTPLTALRQFTDRLRRQPRLDDARRQVCYDAQARAADRLTHLVESLLEFGSLEAGTRGYQLVPHDCGRLVGQFVEDFRALPHASGRTIEFQTLGDAPVQVDAEALRRAVDNLLDNAMKYSSERAPIDVTVEPLGRAVAIRVRDRGLGIPRSERRMIFRKFQRGAQARGRGIRGTGIGLAMVDQIVKAHGGRVQLESAPGAGSTFTIELPTENPGTTGTTGTRNEPPLANYSFGELVPRRGVFHWTGRTGRTGRAGNAR